MRLTNSLCYIVWYIYIKLYVDNIYDKVWDCYINVLSLGLISIFYFYNGYVLLVNKVFWIVLRKLNIVIIMYIYYVCMDKNMY